MSSHPMIKTSGWLLYW